MLYFSIGLIAGVLITYITIAKMIGTIVGETIKKVTK